MDLVARNHNVVIPVLVMNDRAYLLLDPVISSDMEVAPQLKFKDSLFKKFVGSKDSDLMLAGRKCRANFFKFISSGLTVYTGFIYPKKKFHLFELGKDFATTEIGEDIRSSSTISKAAKRASEIIRSFGDSFQEMESSKIVLTQSLHVLHLSQKKVRAVIIDKEAVAIVSIAVLLVVCAIARRILYGIV